ncbi:MAG: alpha/beta family hydrolase [Bacteroidota bacterium]
MKPRNADWLCVLGHGAGAGMRHPFMESISEKLARHNVGTFRFQFPYMEQRLKRPDPKPIIMATIRAAVDAAQSLAGGLPLFLGGKSFGGRMSSTAIAEKQVVGIRGVIFIGFPLHPPGDPSTKRADHLFDVELPMLFLQGTRDKLADLELLRPICKKLRPRVTLHVVDGADHSFHVPKKSGQSDDDVLENLAMTISDWGSRILHET